jgi:hypothetical protein
MKMRTLVIVLIGVIILGACNSIAWDGQHRGFVVGGGIGLTAATLLIRQVDYRLGYQTNFKIGYAIKDHWQIHYSGISIWKMDDLLNHMTLGTTYYFKPQAPTFFASGGLGISWEVWDLSDGGDICGFPTVVAGLGYEIFKHVNIEATILTTSPQYDSDFRWHYHVGLNVLAY